MRRRGSGGPEDSSKTPGVRIARGGWRRDGGGLRWASDVVLATTSEVEMREERATPLASKQ